MAQTPSSFISTETIKRDDAKQTVSPDAVESGKWYHVATSYDGTALRRYANGQLVDTHVNPEGPAELLPWTVIIGENGKLDGFFNGSIDDLRVYDIGLPADAIATIYRSETHDGSLFADLVAGDYHLLSKQGRYWAEHDIWVLDPVGSSCLDLGDPCVYPGNEGMPNGGRKDAGAFGDTAFASLSEWPLLADLNRDGRVDVLTH